MIRSTYAPIGGVERVAVSLIRGLLEKGIKVTLLTLPGQAWPLSHPALSIVTLGVRNGHRLVPAWTFNRSVNRYLASNKNDCVLSLDKVTCFTHLHAGGGTHKTFLKLKARYSSAPERFFLKWSLFHRYILHVEKKGFENPSLVKIRCNSKMVMDIIGRDYGVPPEKMILVHSGIRWKEMEEAFIQRTEVRLSLCRQHKIDPKWKIVLFLGSGFPNKGLDIAIQGLTAMAPDYHLVVVGKGAAKPYQRLAATLGLDKRVHFLGPRPEGWQYASLCKALVLPSQYDPFGGAAAEGHAMGVPVLVSDRTGYADWVVSGENGIVLKAPMETDRIMQAFSDLEYLIEHPVWTPEQLRQHAYNVDDDVILEQLLSRFLNV